MVQIAISGVSGHMGRTLVSSIAERNDCEVCCGIDIRTDAGFSFPVYDSPAKMTEKPDVIIDYSHPSCLDGLLDYAQKTGTPVVLATTGYSDEQLAKIQAASANVALFASGNMSIGIQLLMALAKKAAALMIANAICEETDPPKHLVYDRHSVRKKREMTEIGMHSIRGGTIVGEHEVLFAGPDECISVTHTASSKRVFAEGSVNAALFLIGKAPKLYNMTDLLAEA